MKQAVVDICNISINIKIVRKKRKHENGSWFLANDYQRTCVNQHMSLLLDVKQTMFCFFGHTFFFFLSISHT